MLIKPDQVMLNIKLNNTSQASHIDRDVIVIQSSAHRHKVTDTKPDKTQSPNPCYELMPKGMQSQEYIKI